MRPRWPERQRMPRRLEELLGAEQALLMGEADSVPRVQEAVGAELGRQRKRAG